MMIPRITLTKITHQLENNPAVVILGPRQVGKTTLAKQLAKEWPKPSVYLDLERQSDMAKLREAEFYLKTQVGNLVIIDEIQRMPSLFQTLRSIIDEQRENSQGNGQFLVLGSAALEMIQGVSESLAGRVAYVELGSLNAIEIGSQHSTESLWLRGGFPTSFLAENDQLSSQWRQNFITSYLERDIPALGPRVPAETMRRFWTMLAHSQGQLINQSNIAASLGVSVTTVRRYLDLLVDLMLVRPLQPWSGNIKKRLIKSPKHFIRDSGLLHSLMNITSMDDLLGHPIAGKSWEGFVIENLLSVAPKQLVPMFFEAVGQVEIDLIFEVSPNQRIAIEIKRSLSPSIPKGFHDICNTLGIKQRYIVYPGLDNFPYSEEVEVVSLKHMMQTIIDS